MEEERGRGRGNRGSKCKRCVLSSLTVDSRVESVECLSVCTCACVFKSIYARIWQSFEQDTIQVDWGERRRGIVARSKAVKSVLWGPSPDNMSQLKLQNRTALKNVFTEMGLK